MSYLSYLIILYIYYNFIWKIKCLLTFLKENCRNNSNKTDEELVKKEAHELYLLINYNW